MPGDSKRWEAAYAAYKKDVHTVPGFKKPKAKRPGVLQGHTESMSLRHEYKEVCKEIERLNARRKAIRKLLNGQKLLPESYLDKPIKLYALMLEDNCWYIGQSRLPQKRFKKHLAGKGAAWTKLHPPLEIVEIRDTGLTDDKTACLQEDDMTLEYAMKYGSQYVRGGGYCQTKPHWPPSWPAVVTENELPVSLT